MKETDILILGSSVSAELAACYLRQKLPELEVTLIGPEKEQRPIVGESTISITTRFLIELGLGGLLVDEHYPKYALTYYYKENIDDPEDMNYFVSESPFVLPELSYNLNRFTFDKKIREINRSMDTNYIIGRIRDLDLSDPKAKKVTYKDENGEQQTISSKWVIDATGRSRLLAKKLQLEAPLPPHISQRCSFWFRLKGFDRSILKKVKAIKKDNRAYDSYYVTHHFMGKGNWIWAIPMRSDDGEDLISIGICYRDDLYKQHISKVDSFLEAVQPEHPVVCELVRSGEVLDTQQYWRYMYDCKQMYSNDGWFMIGDACRTVDPLYSTGIAATTMQIQQVGALIDLQNKEECTPEIVNDFDTFMRFHQYGSQGGISSLYEVMHDPYQCQARMHISTLLFFYMLAPHIANKYHCDPKKIKKLLAQLGPQSQIAQKIMALNPIIEKASRASNLTRDQFPEVQGVKAFNSEYFGYLKDEEVPDSVDKLWPLMEAFKKQQEKLIANDPTASVSMKSSAPAMEASP